MAKRAPYLPGQILRVTVLFFVGMILFACQSSAVPPVTPTPTLATPLPMIPNVTPIEPLPPAQTLPPVRLQIPAIELDVSVVIMGWKTAVVSDQRTTEWVIPADKAGWHVNSAGVGAAGNTIISGHQAAGAAVFAPLALGDVAEGQAILLTDSDELTFVYRVVEVTKPIPVSGATETEQQLVASYIAPTESAQLTLITGWPEFTTTHRLFVLAELIGLEK